MKNGMMTVFLIMMSVIMLALMVIGGIEAYQLITGSARAEWEPTTVYPMANANVSWQQTHYSGAWSDGR